MGELSSTTENVEPKIQDVEGALPTQQRLVSVGDRMGEGRTPRLPHPERVHPVPGAAAPAVAPPSAPWPAPAAGDLPPVVAGQRPALSAAGRSAASPATRAPRGRLMRPLHSLSGHRAASCLDPVTLGPQERFLFLDWGSEKKKKKRKENIADKKSNAKCQSDILLHFFIFIFIFMDLGSRNIFLIIKV